MRVPPGLATPRARLTPSPVDQWWPRLRDGQGHTGSQLEGPTAEGQRCSHPGLRRGLAAR